MPGIGATACPPAASVANQLLAPANIPYSPAPSPPAPHSFFSASYAYSPLPYTCTFWVLYAVCLLSYHERFVCLDGLRVPRFPECLDAEAQLAVCARNGCHEGAHL